MSAYTETEEVRYVYGEEGADFRTRVRKDPDIPGNVEVTTQRWNGRQWITHSDDDACMTYSTKEAALIADAIRSMLL